MRTNTMTHADVARIIQGKPAASLARLPAVWQNFPKADYVEAAQLFRHHGTPMAMEALEAIGDDFAADAYPAFDSYAAETTLQQKTLAAVREIFAELGHDVPAALYHVLLDTAFRARAEALMTMFKEKQHLMRDRLQDAVLHAALLVTPVGLYIQSVFSRHGVRFMHVMNCGCSGIETDEAPFTVALDPALKPAYLQNLLAASFEQYGVNASTSRSARGF